MAKKAMIAKQKRKVNSRFATIIAVKYADAPSICASSACAEYVFGNWLIR